MKSGKRYLIASLVLILTGVIGAVTSPPQLINYQGRLLDSGGRPVNGSVDLVFSLYGAADGSSLYLTVTQPNVEVTEGIYNVLIGSGTVTPGIEENVADVFTDHSDVWLGVKVSGEAGDMLPRQRISSVPYAFQAKTVSPEGLYQMLQITDVDEDGFSGGLFSLNGSDCDDFDPSINVGALEVCGDGIDQNCDGYDASCSFTSAIPDTGIAMCSDMTAFIACPSPGQPCYGQDANYGANILVYTNNGDGTITDTQTGLMWQQVDDSAGMTYDEAVQYCEDSTLAGHTDWRMPSILELSTLLLMQTMGPTYFELINTIHFPATQHGFYWTKKKESSNFSIELGFSSSSTILGFYPLETDTFVNESDSPPSAPDDPPALHHVKCVRLGPMDHGTMTDNGDGTVTDQVYNLTWQKEVSPTALPWDMALQYCEDLTLAGHTDWRAPNLKEAATIFYDQWAFMYTGLTMWSSTLSPAAATYAFQYELDGWTSINDVPKTTANYIRCLR